MKTTDFILQYARIKSRCKSAKLVAAVDLRYITWTKKKKNNKYVKFRILL